MPDTLFNYPIGQVVFISTMGLSFLLWTGAYVMMIVAGRRDGFCGMPLAALCANLAWETTYVLIDPHPAYQWWPNLGWLIIDCGIAYQMVKYHKRMFPLLSFRAFLGLFVVGLLTAGFAIHFVGRSFGDDYGVYAAFGQNLMMSVLFVGWLATRPGLPGQRRSIAWLKLLGTLAASAAFLSLEYLDPDKLFREGDLTPILIFLFAATLLFDAIYVVGVHVRRRRHLMAYRPGVTPSAGRR